MHSQLLVGCVLVLGACKSDKRDGDKPATPGSAVTTTGSASAAGSATSSAARAVAPGWERKDLSKLDVPIRVVVDVPPGVTVEASEITYGEAKPMTTVDLVGPGWTVNIEAIRDNEAASAEAAVRGRSLTPEMIVTSKNLDDGGWLLVWKQPTNEHWVDSVRKTANVVCDSNGSLKPEHLETVLKLCDSIRPAS